MVKPLVYREYFLAIRVLEWSLIRLWFCCHPHRIAIQIITLKEKPFPCLCSFSLVKITYQNVFFNLIHISPQIVNGVSDGDVDSGIAISSAGTVLLREERPFSIVFQQLASNIFFKVFSMRFKTQTEKRNATEGIWQSVKSFGLLFIWVSTNSTNSC